MARVNGWLMQKWLYMFYAVIRRSVSLSFISNPDPFIFSGNYFTLYWEVKGCYKISINATTGLPGKTTRVHLDPKFAAAPIRIKFYGYNTVIEKKIAGHIVTTGLKKQLQLQCPPEQFVAELNAEAETGCVFHELTCSDFLVPPAPDLALLNFPTLANNYAQLFISTLKLPEPKIYLDAYTFTHVKP